MQHWEKAAGVGEMWLLGGTCCTFCDVSFLPGDLVCQELLTIHRCRGLRDAREDICHPKLYRRQPCSPFRLALGTDSKAPDGFQGGVGPRHLGGKGLKSPRWVTAAPFAPWLSTLQSVPPRVIS